MFGACNGWRGLVFDQFAGQLTPAVIKCCLERKRMPSVIWGCLTNMLQPADKRQNQNNKKVSSEVEADMVHKKLVKNPKSLGRLTREELLYRHARTAQICAEQNMHIKMAAEYPRSGINLNLEGAQDEVLDTELQGFWHDKRICGGLTMTEWRVAYMEDIKRALEMKELVKTGHHAKASVIKDAMKFKLPDSIDALVASLENPHIPEAELIERTDEDLVYFSTEEKESSALEPLLKEEVPSWLEQRFKVKFAANKGKAKAKAKSKKDKEAEQEAKAKQEAADRLARKKAAQQETAMELEETLRKRPPSDAALQERRDWDADVLGKLNGLLSSPRAKRRVGQYIAERKKTSAQGEQKRGLLEKLTSLKEDGGLIEGGVNIETYDHAMLQKVKKKEKKKEKKAMAEVVAKLRKGAAVQKMIATKKKKKEAAEAAAAAAAAAVPEAAAAEEPATLG